MGSVEFVGSVGAIVADDARTVTRVVRLHVQLAAGHHTTLAVDRAGVTIGQCGTVVPTVIQCSTVVPTVILSFRMTPA